MSLDATSPTESSVLALDPKLLDAVVAGTREGLEMTGITPPAVGASRFFSPRNPMSVIVGLVGQSSGSLTLNVSEKGMLYIAGQMLGEVQNEMTEDVIDAMMEVGNLVAGNIKNLLNDDYKVKAVSLPSVIFGQSYQVLYARGINTISVEFELDAMSFGSVADRFFSSTVSLLQGSGVGG